MGPLPTPERVSPARTMGPGDTHADGWWVWLCVTIFSPISERRDLRVVWVKA